MANAGPGIVGTAAGHISWVAVDVKAPLADTTRIVSGPDVQAPPKSPDISPVVGLSVMPVGSEPLNKEYCPTLSGPVIAGVMRVFIPTVNVGG